MLNVEIVLYRNERERPPRPPSDEKHHVEERPKRDRDHRDRRNKEPRHSKDEINTDGWGDHPTDFHTHSYGPPQGFRAGPFSKYTFHLTLASYLRISTEIRIIRINSSND